MSSGVYTISHVESGKLYIGSSVNVAARIQSHKDALGRGKHDNSHLQNAWNKYGYKAFIFALQEECTHEECQALEQIYLDALQPYGDNGFNLRRGANCGPHAPETIAKMKKRVFTEHTRNLISAAAKKRGYTDNLHKGAAWSKSEVGRKHSAETMRKMRGRKHSVETKRKMSESRAGQRKGIPLSKEHKDKISKTLSGRKLPDETRDRMSKRMKALWANNQAARLLFPKRFV